MIEPLKRDARRTLECIAWHGVLWMRSRCANVDNDDIDDDDDDDMSNTYINTIICVNRRYCCCCCRSKHGSDGEKKSDLYHYIYKRGIEIAKRFPVLCGG
jgi:hypothetical protein